MSNELRDVTRIGPPMPKPVEVFECWFCAGSGYVETRVNRDGMSEMHTCAYCAGRGRIVTEGGEA